MITIVDYAAGNPTSVKRALAAVGVESVISPDADVVRRAEGIEVDRRAIVLDDPIKNIGLFTVPVRLHRDVTASVRVYVIRA